MPKVGQICGIVFHIFNEMGAPHHLKHVMVTYGDDSANFDIETGRLLSGNLKPSQMRKVRKILSKEYNKNELLKRWDFLNQENVQEACRPIQFQ